MGRVLVPKPRAIHSGDSKFHGAPIAGRLFHCGVNGGQDSELDARVDCAAHSQALPSGHPFADVQDTFWSSTTSLFEPDWAWALYLEKGATGVGQKRSAQFSVWAVATVD